MRVVRLSVVAAMLAVVVFASAAVVLADGRVALVVGNSTYDHLGGLPNPEHDAIDMAAALARLGFDVTTELDADRVAAAGGRRREPHEAVAWLPLGARRRVPGRSVRSSSRWSPPSRAGPSRTATRSSPCSRSATTSRTSTPSAAPRCGSFGASSATTAPAPSSSRTTTGPPPTSSRPPTRSSSAPTDAGRRGVPSASTSSAATTRRAATGERLDPLARGRVQVLPVRGDAVAQAQAAMM